jgi:TolA-binding protein
MNTVQTILRSIVIAGLSIVLFFMIGCSGSQEAEKENVVPELSAPTIMQKQVSDLRTENASLKQQLERLQQDNRTITAHAAELETQLADMKERPAPTPLPPVVEEKVAPVTTPPPVNASSAYEEGLSMYRQKNYRGALEKFEAISSDVDGGFADRGLYWSGECRYALKDYSGALESFKKVPGFRNSTKSDDAQMMMGNCYLALGNKSQAKAEFNKLITQYPASPFVKRAKAKMKGL